MRTGLHLNGQSVRMTRELVVISTPDPKWSTHPLGEEPLRLIRRESQCAGPHLEQLTPGPEPCQGQGGIDPSGDRQMSLRRQVVEQERHRPLNLGCLDEVVVVEHEDLTWVCTAWAIPSGRAVRADRKVLISPQTSVGELESARLSRRPTAAGLQVLA